MKEAVSEAIVDLKEAYGQNNVEVTNDDDGGAIVIVSNLDIGEKFIPSRIWCGFHISFMYPAPDIYPHFINPDIKRADQKELAGAFSSRDWNKRPVIQVSRKSKNWDPAQDTAHLKLEKVLNYIRNL